MPKKKNILVATPSALSKNMGNQPAKRKVNYWLLLAYGLALTAFVVCMVFARIPTLIAFTVAVAMVGLYHLVVAITEMSVRRQAMRVKQEEQNHSFDALEPAFRAAHAPFEGLDVKSSKQSVATSEKTIQPVAFFEAKSSKMTQHSRMESQEKSTLSAENDNLVGAHP